MILNTDRLTLRELEKSDIQNMYLLGSNPDLTKYMDYIVFKNLEEAGKWVAEKIAANNEYPRFAYNFAIETKNTKEFAGWIGIGKASDKTKGDLDFGYAILPKFQGQGIATEALKAILEMAWRETKANIIFGECDINNLASRKVMEKVGMKFETEFEEDNQKQVRYSILRSLKLFNMLAG